MKILYVTTISGTINAFLIPHINLLLDEGHSVDIACNITKPIEGSLLDRGCKVFNTNFQRSPFKQENLEAYKKLKKIINDENYDMVHTHTPIASIIARLACRSKPGIKVLYTAHGFHFFKGASLKNIIVYSTIEKLFAKYTDGIITINQEDYDSARKFKLKRKNSVYKINGVGVDLDKFAPTTESEKSDLRKEYGYNYDDFILFYAAELNTNKHQDLLIDTISDLKKVIPNIKLLLAGNGSMRGSYEAQVKKLRLHDNVHFLGYRKDVDKLLKLSDVAVASSRREGLPVNIMEAMAIGLPLVVTNCRGQRDLVDNGENGFVVGIDDNKAFGNAIKKLYNSVEIREKISRNNIERSKIYSIKNVLKELKGIYAQYLLK
ncbi:MAG: glycosyltransferase family 4 protein [Bacillota bacterium]